MLISGFSSGRFGRGARLVALGIAVTAVLAVPAASAASASAASAASAVSGASVPWSKAGSGWSVVQYSNAKVAGNQATGQISTLYLVSPSGKKFAVHSWKGGSVPHLIDWSGDRKRALLVTQVTATASPLVEQVSLVTGKVLGKFYLPSLTSPIGYTKPDGQNILAVSYGSYDSTRLRLIRYNLAGVQQRVLAAISNGFAGTLYAPNGTYLIATARGGLSQISNAGGVIKRLHPSVAQDSCSPIRWWNSTTVLAICFRTPQDSAARLWLFHLRTGRSSPLTAASGSNQNNAWYLSDGRFLQESTVCSFLAQVYRNGSVHKAPVPGNGEVQIAGAVGGRLLLVGSPRCGGYAQSSSLLWFDPKRHSVSYLIHPGKNVLGVLAVVPFGGTSVFG